MKVTFEDYDITILVSEKVGSLHGLGPIVGKRTTSNIEVAEQILYDVPKWIESYERHREVLNEAPAKAEGGEKDVF